MLAERHRVLHPFRNTEAGIDSGRAPNILLPNQLAFGVNLTVRGGYPANRPGFFKHTLSGIDSGRFQGAAIYRQINKPNTGKIALMVGGQLWLVTPPEIQGPACDVEEITIPGDPNSPSLEQSWIIQAEDFLIAQDGESAALIYDGVSSRRSDIAAKEIPTGTRMAYGNGRLWVSNNRSFVASDIVGGPSGTEPFEKRDAILHFTENDYIAEGGFFSVPNQSGEITGMVFIANLDTTLGQGELVVGTRNAVYSVNVPADRTLWKDLNIPLQRLALLSYGPRSQNSIVNANSDLFFRSDDGIRSLIFARRNFAEWGNVPCSREMNRLLPKDDRTLLGFGSGVVFDNRLLMTLSPARDATYGVYHRGLAALDFDLISSMWNKTSPAWEGVWTGLNILQILKGDFGGSERCFILALNSDKEIELWEISLNDFADRPSSAEYTPIEWQIEYPSAIFRDAGSELKKLLSADLWVDQLRDQADLAFQYRPDQYPIWQDWHSWTICGPTTVCTPDCSFPGFPNAQYRTRRILPQPADDDETFDNKPMRLGYEFQPKISITGPCRIRQFRIHAATLPEHVDDSCPTDESCSALTGCSDNPFTYNSSG